MAFDSGLVVSQVNHHIALSCVHSSSKWSVIKPKLIPNSKHDISLSYLSPCILKLDAKIHDRYIFIWSQMTDLIILHPLQCNHSEYIHVKTGETMYHSALTSCNWNVIGSAGSSSRELCFNLNKRHTYIAHLKFLTNENLFYHGL